MAFIVGWYVHPHGSGKWIDLSPKRVLPVMFVYDYSFLGPLSNSLSTPLVRPAELRELSCGSHRSIDRS